MTHNFVVNKASTHRYSKSAKNRLVFALIGALILAACATAQSHALNNTAAAAKPNAVNAQDSKFDYGRIGTTTIYQPKGAPTSVVLFLSGDGGWNLGVIDMAKALRDRGALVAGIDTTHFYKSFGADQGPCTYPAADFESYAHALEAKYHLSNYQYPILVGYSSGATLAYGLLNQAPAGTFAGALSLGFCPDFEMSKPLCEANLLRTRIRSKAPKGFDFLAVKSTPAPWIVLQGDSDQVCDTAATVGFVNTIANSTLVRLPKVGHGFSVPKNWQPHYLIAFDTLVQHAQLAHARRTAPAVARASTPNGAPSGNAARAPKPDDLPLIEVPTTSGQSDTIAVLFTGDGGWAGLDQELAAAMAARGVSVVGLSTLEYFWSAKTPAQTSADLDRVIHYYAQTWNKSKVIVVGYSMGADVATFAVNGLSSQSLARVQKAVLFAPGKTAEFAFHLSNWVSDSNAGIAIAPAIMQSKVPITCVYAKEDTDSVCPILDSAQAHVFALPGGHHFGGEFAKLAELALAKK